MFKITEGMARAWKAWNKPIATPADIAFIEGSLGIRLAADYVDFVTTHGFVLFGRDEPERRCLFSHVIEKDDQRVTRQCELSFLFNATQVVTRYRYMTTADDPEDETRPSIPPGFLPVGSDAGHGAILLDIAAHPGQVWFWQEDYDRWGLGDNTTLGFVAGSFAELINSLRPSPL